MGSCDASDPGPERREDVAENVDAVEGGGDGNVLEGFSGCSVSRLLLPSNSLNSAAARSRVEVAKVQHMLRSSPSSEETSERRSKCE